MFEALNKRLAERKSIDIISQELCPGISKGRDKVIKIIKMHRGGKYLLDNHEWLGYHTSNIRNPTGKTTYKVKPKKSEMLFKPSLSTRKPSTEEYGKWTDSLTSIANILTELGYEMTGTTEGRYLWKVNELKKRTTELRTLIKEKTNDFDSSEVCCKDPEEKPKYNKIEIHRKIFEIAKEQISLVGKIDASKIAEELKINILTTRNHLKKLNSELELLIKKWQDERDKMVRTETKVDSLAQ